MVTPERTVFFELPGTAIRGIPLQAGGENLNIGFIEVGCRPYGKRKQLKDKRELFRSFWYDHYILSGAADWYPIVRRTLVHYDPESFQKGVFNVQKEYNPDVVLFYRYISEQVLLTLSDGDKEAILKCADLSMVPRLELLLSENDSEGLQSLIINDRQKCRQANLRGKLAEMITLNDVQTCLPRGMSLYRNGDIKFFQDKLNNGTEVDGILLSYGTEPYWNLVENIGQSLHVVLEIDYNLRKN